MEATLRSKFQSTRFASEDKEAEMYLHVLAPGSRSSVSYESNE